jgi:hypothetical protein
MDFRIIAVFPVRVCNPRIFNAGKVPESIASWRKRPERPDRGPRLNAEVLVATLRSQDESWFILEQQRFQAAKYVQNRNAETPVLASNKG